MKKLLSVLLTLIFILALAGCEQKTYVDLTFGPVGEDGYAYSTSFVTGDGAVTVSAGAGVTRVELIFVPAKDGDEVGPLTLEQRKDLKVKLTAGETYRVAMKKDAGAAAEITVTGVNVKTA